jgi:hypothetical protein
MPSPLSNHIDQTTATRFVVFVLFEMLCELLNSAREYRDLDLRRPGVTIVPMIFADQLGLFFLRKRHIQEFLRGSATVKREIIPL